MKDSSSLHNLESSAPKVPKNPHRVSGHSIQQRATMRKPARPSTAPTVVREDLLLLPSIPASQSYSSKASLSAVAERLRSIPDSKRPRNGAVRHMHTLLEDEVDVSASLNLEAYPTSDTSETPSDPSLDKPVTFTSSDCDWATFITAYAAGRWDPHRTPNPPRSCQQIVSESHRYSCYDPSKSNDYEIPVDCEVSHVQKLTAERVPSASPLNRTDERSPLIPLLPPSLSGLSIASTGSIKSHPNMPLRLPLPSHRLYNSFSATHSNSPGPQTASSVSDVRATVATMRWAAARVDISPLALPSPEHELTDPMRGVTATIPGSHSQDLGIINISPASTVRKSRLNGFWEGMTDVNNWDATQTDEAVNGEKPSLLKSPPIISSGSETPPLSDTSTNSPSTSLISSLSFSANHGPSVVTMDYFGGLNAPTPDLKDEPSTSPRRPPLLNGQEHTMTDQSPVSVPAALPRRLCLTRQTSSPLPESCPQEPRYLGGRAPSESIASVKMGRAAKEESMFSDLEYLAPPYPPDELERRRALYKFNIWNTGPDLNFDRIAHLAKLVFSTKGVVISLIDGQEQWFKSEWGLKTPSCARAHSFCGHAILQRGDEPMVVLDTHKDWRFQKNPLTIGPPCMRFYAGAPLRTQDGYNIGTLAVIDDQARDEFSPRQLHTLKEFAAIAMREMELWRDKIQLRIRDRIQTSMEEFSRECLEIDSETHDFERPDLIVGSSMDKVYDRAAKLVKRTLDVEGVIVMDVTHCEVLESMSAEGSVSVTLHHGDPSKEMTRRQLTTEEYHNLHSFFEKYPDGRISEGIIPPSFKPFLPTHVQYALTVPIFNIDKRPFALLCAYNTLEHANRFLEGHELSYLRAIGVIILSAVLKRRMILADKAKGLFISNISHELRTPLHGILAAAELLSESSLNHSQASFLQTVQACGTSLVETVNHVLDFTKLSGNSKAGGVENVIVPSSVDLMQLVEEAIDGCWIGHRARTAIMDDSGIGSVYSPPSEDHGSPVATRRKLVETIVDIGYRRDGWNLKCEKGGIRRVLMNIFGNSLKFTSDGYVHVLLHQLPPCEDDAPNKVRVELSVFDTGKGISQNFLKNQLFHPFSQENPLQTGTGLGLAIVSSIVTSENVGGKVDVWSEEGIGTEIKVTFPAEMLVSDQIALAPEMEQFRTDGSGPLPTVSLVGFSVPHKGIQLLNDVLHSYLTTWWGFQVVEDNSDIVVLNDDLAPILAATGRRDTSRAYIILSASRGSPMIMSIASEHERIGGFCRVLYKPGGPSRLRAILKLAIHALKIGKSRGPSPMVSLNGDPAIEKERSVSGSSIPRRHSDDLKSSRSLTNFRRPTMTARSSTANPIPTNWDISRTYTTTMESFEVNGQDTTVPTISLGSGGILLKSSLGTLDPERRFRVLVVEDNSILRNLLIKWLSTKNYEYRSAVDGRDGVIAFEKDGPFDVVLLDLSMPVLDGIGATEEIRLIEEKSTQTDPELPRSRILALTGMSSLEDKRRAFEAGVDGYLVKPVAFKTLDDMFHKLGVTS